MSPSRGHGGAGSNQYTRQRAAKLTPPASGMLFAQATSDTRNARQAAAAWDQATPPEELLGFTDHPDKTVRYNLARNPRCPTNVLRALALDHTWEVRFWVAYHKNTPPDLLEILSLDHSPKVRSKVARNPRTDPAVLQRLVTDRERFVLCQLARNPATPVETLTRLATSHDGAVRLSAQRNPSLPKHVLAMVQLTNY